MTTEQHAIIQLLRERRYGVRSYRHAKNDVLLVTVRRRLSTGTMPLRIYPDGSYVCPWYDTQNTPTRKVR